MIWGKIFYKMLYQILNELCPVHCRYTSKKVMLKSINKTKI